MDNSSVPVLDQACLESRRWSTSTFYMFGADANVAGLLATLQRKNILTSTFHQENVFVLSVFVLFDLSHCESNKTKHAGIKLA